MNLFYWATGPEKVSPPRYNDENGNIVTFNLSGQKNYSYSRITLNKFKDSELYKYAYLLSASKLVLDDNNYIYLDLCPTIFRHIHDYMKGYDLRLDDMNLRTKERLYRDAKLLNIDQLVREMEQHMPTYDKETMNYWANVIAKSVIAMGVNVETIFKSFTGTDLEYNLSQKLRDLFEKDPNIRDRVRKCVKTILESKCQNGNQSDKLILDLLLEISKDTNPRSLLERFLSNLM